MNDTNIDENSSHKTTIIRQDWGDKGTQDKGWFIVTMLVVFPLVFFIASTVFCSSLLFGDGQRPITHCSTTVGTMTCFGILIWVSITMLGDYKNPGVKLKDADKAALMGINLGMAGMIALVVSTIPSCILMMLEAYEMNGFLPPDDVVSAVSKLAGVVFWTAGAIVCGYFVTKVMKPFLANYSKKDKDSA